MIVPCHALVDYHNLPSTFTAAGTISIARSIDSLICSVVDGPGDTHIRLYGGWYDERGLSRDGTRIAQEIGADFPFPLRGRDGMVRYLQCEIASSLLDAREDLFPSTLRKRHGLDLFIKDHHPERCLNIDDCPVNTVLSWSRRKKCPKPGCSVTTIDAFVCNQQKLVNALLCCDLISIALAGPTAAVFVVSEDDDVIPALVMAGLRGGLVWHVRTKTAKERLYDSFLASKGVRSIYL